MNTYSNNFTYYSTRFINIIVYEYIYTILSGLHLRKSIEYINTNEFYLRKNILIIKIVNNKYNIKIIEVLSLSKDRKAEY